MGKARSPGPVYMLPTTIGYRKHDFSRYRNPQYTMSPRLVGVSGKDKGPGPQYQIRGLNEHGKYRPPAYSIKSRPKPLTRFIVPGPGAYSPEKAPRMKDQRPAAYTMQGRPKFMASTIGPGPAYGLPPLIGPKVPNKQASQAYTMIGRHPKKDPILSPGPANYRGINTNIYKIKKPIYTMAARLDRAKKQASPGPAAYLPKKLCGEKGLMYSLRSRNPPDVAPFIVAEDNMPCADH